MAMLITKIKLRHFTKVPRRMDGTGTGLIETGVNVTG